MAKKSLSMILERFGEPLVARELEIPSLEEGQILAKVTAAGICGSDIHMWLGEDPRTPVPMILGHEGVGIIEDIRGKKLSVEGVELGKGQPVLWNRGIVCGECYWCTTASQPWLCRERWVYGIHRSINQPTHLNGCYSEYIVLDRKTDIFVLPQDVDHSVLVPASCSGATAAHALWDSPPEQGGSVVILGPGPLGIFGIAFAAEYGASEIVVVGSVEDEERLRMCKDFGATTTFNIGVTSPEERKEAVLELTDGRGADIVMEATGNPHAFKEGLQLVRRGGDFISVGIATPVGEVTLDPYSDLNLKDISMRGIWVSHTSHTEKALKLILEKEELFKRMITHRFPLRDANEAFASVQRREALKAVLIP